MAVGFGLSVVDATASAFFTCVTCLTLKDAVRLEPQSDQKTKVKAVAERDLNLRRQLLALESLAQAQ